MFSENMLGLVVKLSAATTSPSPVNQSNLNELFFGINENGSTCDEISGHGTVATIRDDQMIT
jgi:hypothetical protein